ncbi:hypothetical protein ACQ4PT_001827 [Festuca glaucescens]
MERYMKSALQKYNAEEKLSEDMYFEFEQTTQACSTTCLFFAEAIPDDGDSFDITCCKLLTDGDNGHCYWLQECTCGRYEASSLWQCLCWGSYRPDVPFYD